MSPKVSCQSARKKKSNMIYVRLELLLCLGGGRGRHRKFRTRAPSRIETALCAHSKFIANVVMYFEEQKTPNQMKTEINILK